MSYTSDTSRPNGARPTAEVKENISALKEDATKLAGSVKHLAQGAVEDGRHRIEEAREVAVERAATIFTSLENQVRTRPAAALGITLGAGLLLGLMMAGRRH